SSNRRGHRTNRIYLFRFKRQFEFNLSKETTPGQLEFDSDYLTFTLNDFIGVEGVPQQWPFEDYRIPLAKVELKLRGDMMTIGHGIGHTVPIQDSRIRDFKLKNQKQDPLANWDGARQWLPNRGFKRIVRPKPQITVQDLTATNLTGSLFLNSSRSGWLPLQLPNGTTRDGAKIVHYGLAWSWPQPVKDLTYMAEVTIYVTFRQMASTLKNMLLLNNNAECLNIANDEDELNEYAESMENTV
ncbi:capsid protein, partial [Penguin circovirus]